jgi:L-lactate dehydrogenase
MYDPIRIAVVGAGNVGSTFAYALLLSGLASEIVLIDADHARAEGQAMDLDHAVPFNRPVRVWAGTYDDIRGAQVTVVSAGTGQKPGETRLDLLRRNVGIFRDVIGNVAAANPDGIILIATNPVDVLTFAACRISGHPPSRVFGSGTILDTARFRYLLAKRFGVDPRSLHAHIIGEHGDSEVPVWSLANIAGARLADLSVDSSVMEDIFRQTRDAAYHIIERKGSTYYAVAAGLLRIVEALVRDQHTVLSVSSLLTGQYGLRDVCLSLPSVVDRSGIARILELPLDPNEIEQLRRSAAILKAGIAELELA